MGRVRNAPTPRKSGVSHGIKKAKAKTTSTLSTGSRTSSRRSSVAAKAELKESARKILKEVENLPDHNENTTTKVMKKEEVENDIKTEAEYIKTEEGEEDYSDEEGMSSYEKQRQKNIQAREEMFKDILVAKKRVSDVFTPKQETKAASKRGLASVPREREVLPPRKSARLAGGKVPEIQRFIPELAPEPERETLPPLETLKAEDVFKYDEDNEKLEHAKQFFSNYSSKVSEGKLNTKITSKQYLEGLKKWKITPELVAKVVPDRIFSVAVHPSEHKLLASAGGKWGAVGLWDIKDTESKENGVYLFNPHVRPVNWQSWDRYNHENLVTTSYDGTCRILDINKMESRLVYGDQKFLESRAGYCTMHQQLDANTYLITKGKTGTLGLLDLRAGHESTVQDYHVFDRVSAKCISVHPVQTNMVLAANNKGGSYIFDVRQKKSTKSGLLDPVCELIGHPRSVSSATFNCTGSKVATLCWDDKLRVFDTTVLKGNLKGKDVRHNNNTGRWLTPFKGLWHPSYDDVYFTGSMSQPREMEAWHLTTSITKAHSFRGDDLGSICSVLAIHPTLDLLIGGNSSGRVHAFM